MSKANRKTTSVFAMTLLLFAIFLSFVSEYDNLNQMKEELIQSEQINKTTFNTMLYHSLYLEAKQKTDRIKNNIQREMSEHYESDAEFIKDYDSLLYTPSFLSNLLDKNINNPSDRFFRVETDSNDMFIISETGVAVDRSEDCSSDVGVIRTFDNEFKMHYRPDLASTAINSILRGEELGVFWRFRNSTNKDHKQVTTMNIDEVLKLPLEDLKDYEFLVPSYISKKEDFIGVPVTSAQGARQPSRRLVVIQGFNLYEQILAHHKSEYTKVVANNIEHINIIKTAQKNIIVKMLLVIIIAIIIPIMIAREQKLAYKKEGGYGE